MTVATFVKTKANVDDSKPANVKELILDGCKIKQLSTEDQQYLSQFQNLQVLCLNSTQLNSLENFPILPNVALLELTDNKLSGKSNLPSLIEKLPNLKSLSLAGNRFQNIQDLAPLVQLKQLEDLDIEMNPCYPPGPGGAITMEALFRELPQLKYINHTDREGNAVEDEDDEQEEDEDEEDDNAMNAKKKNLTLLEAFYKKDYNDAEDDEEEDEEDFNPESFSDSDALNSSDDDDEESVEKSANEGSNSDDEKKEPPAKRAKV